MTNLKLVQLRLTVITFMGPIAIGGCSSIHQTIDVSKIRPPYRIDVYEAGKPVWQESIAAKSAEEKRSLPRGYITVHQAGAPT